MIGIVNHTDHELVGHEADEGAAAQAPDREHEAREQVEEVRDQLAQPAQQPVNLPPSLVVHQHLFRPATILILGDSHVRRLMVYSDKQFGTYDNMGLHFQVANVNWYGIGGLTIERLRSSHYQIVTEVKPDIVYVHIGGNDLSCLYKSPEDVGEALEDLVADLHDSQVKQIVISQQLFRAGRGLPARMDYNRKVTVYNYFNKITYNANASNIVRYWYHKGLWNRRYTMVDREGVHFNSRGNRLFYRSVRGALLQALARVRPLMAVPQVVQDAAPAPQQIAAPAPQPIVWEF